jgi:hypothetical protein
MSPAIIQKEHILQSPLNCCGKPKGEKRKEWKRLGLVRGRKLLDKSELR